MSYSFSTYLNSIEDIIELLGYTQSVKPFTVAKNIPTSLRNNIYSITLGRGRESSEGVCYNGRQYRLNRQVNISTCNCLTTASGVLTEYKTSLDKEEELIADILFTTVSGSGAPAKLINISSDLIDNKDTYLITTIELDVPFKIDIQ